jgi:chemotaxis regulatin CheY-phosphate phosphatase CheZ
MDRLTGIVEALAASAIAHDNRVEALITIAEKHENAIEDLHRQWQAYFNTLPRH